MSTENFEDETWLGVSSREPQHDVAKMVSPALVLDHEEEPSSSLLEDSISQSQADAEEVAIEEDDTTTTSQPPAKRPRTGAEATFGTSQTTVADTPNGETSSEQFAEEEEEDGNARGPEEAAYDQDVISPLHGLASPTSSKDVTVTASSDDVNGTDIRVTGDATFLCSHFNELPHEIILKVFVYLEFVDLANAALVCRHWKSLSSDDVLWKRLYYELWGTHAKTWKQLFGSHYPEYEIMDMQNLCQEMTQVGDSLARRHIMDLYKLKKSYTGKEIGNFQYPALYRDVWSLTPQEIKSIVANEVSLTARQSHTPYIELSMKMQQFKAEDYEEINSYDRAQSMVWELLRFEGEGDKKIWMEEEDASHYTQWLFSYFPYKKMDAVQAARVKMLQEKENEIPENKEQELSNQNSPRIGGSGIIVGVGEMLTSDSTENDAQQSQATLRDVVPTPTEHTTPTVNAKGSEDTTIRGCSRVVRFFHTGPIQMDDSTFVYGFVAISSSRFCTYWIETFEPEQPLLI